MIFSVSDSGSQLADVTTAAGFSAAGCPASAATLMTLPSRPLMVAVKSITLSRMGVPDDPDAAVPPDASGAVPTRPIMAV